VDDRRQRLNDARLYLVCDRRPMPFLRAALRGGVDVVQLRLKHARDPEILEAARELAPLCAEHGALFILNDRPDLIAAAGADGVHVGQDDTVVPLARELVGPELIVGLSTHSPEQVDAARGVDYIGVGPVHETPTKLGRAAVGVELVRYAAAHAHVPFFAIGGLDERNVDDVLEAGARRIVVLRAIADADDPEAAARALCTRLDERASGGELADARA
jgi:thiamine-phosphate pyrophosphorylase